MVVEWYGVSSAESVPIAQSNIQRKNRFKESTEQDQQRHDVVNVWCHKALDLFKFLMFGCAKSTLKTFSGKTQRIILWSVDSPQGSLQLQTFLLPLCSTGCNQHRKTLPSWLFYPTNCMTLVILSHQLHDIGYSIPSTT